MQRIENYNLAGHNTFRMDARCTCYIEYDNAADLEKIDWDSLPKPIKHIGEGSNLLITGDFPGTILHSAIKYIKYVDMGLDQIPVMVGSGVNWDSFVEETCSHGLWGAENLSLIPGEVGAGAVQNIGAYGTEIKDIISGIVCYDLAERKKVKFQTCECDYRYRDSMFKNSNGRYIVTSVLFRLSRKYSPRLEYKGIRKALGLPETAAMEDPADLTPMQVRKAIIDVRNEKLPDPKIIGSAGSFFKNPVVSAAHFATIRDLSRKEFGADVTVPHFINPDGTIKIPAAWMIDRCGLKGATQGGAAVYEKQPLVIVNASGCAKAEDVIKLEERIIRTVESKFGVTLHPEVEHL